MFIKGRYSILSFSLVSNSLSDSYFMYCSRHVLHWSLTTSLPSHSSWFRSDTIQYYLLATIVIEIRSIGVEIFCLALWLIPRFATLPNLTFTFAAMLVFSSLSCTVG